MSKRPGFMDSTMFFQNDQWDPVRRPLFKKSSATIVFIDEDQNFLILVPCDQYKDSMFLGLYHQTHQTELREWCDDTEISPCC